MTNDHTNSSLITPITLGLAFLLPLIGVVGLYALLIGAMCVPAGMDPAPAIWQFLTESAITLLPLATSLLEIWLIYTAFYAIFVYSHFVIWFAHAALFAIIVYSRWRELTITARVVCEATTPAILDAVRCLVQGRYTHIRLIPRLTDKLRGFTHRGQPDHLSAGWHPGAHPHLE